MFGISLYVYMCMFPTARGEGTTLDLVGVVSHSGTLKSGHYVAYVKRVGVAAPEGTGTEAASEAASVEDVTDAVEAVTLEEQAADPAQRVEQWYYVSDTNVNKVSVAKVLACEAYVLFYAKR